ncbi:hypothetical protein [Dipodfec virus UA23Rod_1071]|uniref:Uncharacterized protein n=1 Tax=Dipodfec virus UA23Rod_1071 TaxID=2929326 RepID=A0A976R5F8_9VIRU|nr:hypothetical protein [Dipodfec virus UA23Rod_1071]
MTKRRQKMDLTKIPEVKFIYIVRDKKLDKNYKLNAAKPDEMTGWTEINMAGNDEFIKRQFRSAIRQMKKDENFMANDLELWKKAALVNGKIEIVNELIMTGEDELPEE